MDVYRDGEEGVCPIPLEMLIMRTYSKILATDPRDRFFALLALATNQDWYNPKPDYSLGRDEVFLKATIHLMRKMSSPDILQCGENLPRALEDPSWLPCWDHGHESYEARHFIQRHAYTDVKFSMTVSEDLRVLTLSGLIMSEVSSLFMFQPENDKTEPPSCILKWKRAVEELGEQLPNPYLRSCERLEAFARCLIAGSDNFVSSVDKTGLVPLINTFND